MKPRAQEIVAELDAFRARKTEPQPDLFSIGAEAHAAIVRVHDHAPNQWKDAALEAVKAAAIVLEYVTVDDIDWPDMPVYDDRAHGGVMRQAARNGWITSTEQYRPSHRAETHRRPLLVWESRIYRGGEAA